jgi:hypothetical protein
LDFTFWTVWRIVLSMNWRNLLLFGWLSAAVELRAADSVFLVESNLVCVRPVCVSDNFFEKIAAVRLTGKPTGTILDLRFAGGDASTVDAAVKFFSVKKTPLVILVNSQTRDGAAELAAKLRAAKAGILIGADNSPGKIFPDIAVNVSTNDEKRFLENPYATETNTAPKFAKGDLLPFVDHISEAELVQRKIKDGEDAEDADLTPRSAPAQPVLRDPALARATDLLKALAALNPPRG